MIIIGPHVVHTFTYAVHAHLFYLYSRCRWVVELEYCDYIYYILGCMDDNNTTHSIGQPFVTTDGHQCFCGSGGNITCDRSTPESGK